MYNEHLISNQGVKLKAITTIFTMTVLNYSLKKIFVLNWNAVDE